MSEQEEAERVLKSEFVKSGVLATTMHFRGGSTGPEAYVHVGSCDPNMAECVVPELPGGVA